jgi:small neutral amino acid transporter SnatA (MarC family)
MEITIGNLIKIILAVLVVAAVAYGLYVFFSSRVMDSFKNIGVNVTGDLVKFLITLF